LINVILFKSEKSDNNQARNKMVESS
jgi:hypothetical protein